MHSRNHRMATWGAFADSVFHSISITDRFVRMSRSDAGPETSGGNDVPAARFLRSHRLQQQVREIFGEPVLAEVLAAARSAATLPLAPRTRR